MFPIVRRVLEEVFIILLLLYVDRWKRFLDWLKILRCRILSFLKQKNNVYTNVTSYSFSNEEIPINTQ
jgi:hypothetical protein